MTAKQKAKHIADKQAVPLIPVGTTLTPDGLGTWKGGVQKGAPNWASAKSRATRTADAKGTPKIKKFTGSKEALESLVKNAAETFVKDMGDSDESSAP